MTNGIYDGDVEGAKQLIEPLLKKRRLHVTEFSGLAGAQIHLCLAQGQISGARSWLAMWKKAVPDDPSRERWRQRLARTPWGWLGRMMQRAHCAAAQFAGTKDQDVLSERG